MGNECNTCDNVRGLKPGKLEELEQGKLSLPNIPQIPKNEVPPVSN